LGAGRRHQGQLPQLDQVVAPFPGETEVDRITLPPLDRLGNLDPSHGGGDHLIDVFDIEPDPGRRDPVRTDLQITPARDPL